MVNRLKPDGGDAEDLLAGLWPGDEVSPLIVRAATSLGATTTSGWASEIAAVGVADFVDQLTPQSAAAALFRRSTRLSFAGTASLSLPSIVTAASASWIGEAAPIGVSDIGFDAALLTPSKLAALVVVSEELLKYSTAETACRLALGDRREPVLVSEGSFMRVNAGCAG